MRLKINFRLNVLLILVGMVSCSSEKVSEEGNDNQESGNSKTELIDFSETEIVGLIKMNFVKELGGIEEERSLINEMVLTEEYSCSIDTNITLEIGSPNKSYELKFKGNLHNRCDANFMVYNDHFIYFISKGSYGSSTLAPYKIEFDMNTTIDIGGNINDNVYKYSGTTFRNLTFIEGLNENQKIGGIIRFTSNFCPFDFRNNEHSEKIEYEVLLSLYNQKVLGDEVKILGTILKESSNWVLKLENGTAYILS